MSFFGGVSEFCGNFVPVILFAVVRIVNFSIHFDKVYNSAERVFLADGKLDGNGMSVKPFPHHIDSALEVCAVDIHFVDVCYTGNLILVRLTPNGLGLRFYAAFGAECSHGAVKNAKRTLDFNGEVNVSGGVDDVYAALVLFGKSRSCPMAGGSRGSDGYTSLLLLYHPVHSSGTVVRFAYLMVDTGVIQNTLGRRGLTRVDMRHNTDISRMQ